LKKNIYPPPQKMSIPVIRDIYEILFNEDVALAFLIEKHIIYPQPKCHACQGNTTKYRTTWKCTSRACRKSVSIYRDSCFKQTKLKLSESLAIAYFWLCGDSHSKICVKTGHSSQTISRNINFLRHIIASNVGIKRKRIGGPGIVVEIDESKFGRRKYNRGHRVEGVWVMGGVERTKERGVFLVEVPDRRAETLLKLIKKYVRDGSIVYTDMFSSYRNLERELGMMHFTVNHSLGFINPETGVHTNTIEGTWCGIKFKINPRNRVKKFIKGCLEEFIWRRKNKGNLWLALLECLKAEFFNN
jgi:transposase-like protein